MPIRVGVLTISDKGSRGERVDTSGPAISQAVTAIDAEVQLYEIVPDDRETIAEYLRSWSDDDHVDVIFTTGGTGLTPRDVTVDATLDAVEHLIPGIAEAMRNEGLKHTPMSMLSRAVAGVRRQTLIINLPGSEKAVRENIGVVLPVLQHAVDSIRGRTGDHIG
ncbi:MAG TPA: MogA/MoaB family molybdenum cofactor biosynthesis protein [Dehalococcoidia bacterium]|nr:MogA/MoaB family molybdenum cofactor biosynthesis protein [Dehalococcoidia bacterium]